LNFDDVAVYNSTRKEKESSVRGRIRRSRSVDDFIVPDSSSSSDEEEEVSSRKEPPRKGKRTEPVKEKTFEESWVDRAWRTPTAKPRATTTKELPTKELVVTLLRGHSRHRRSFLLLLCLVCTV
jgi:hypothetical protein